MAQKRMVIRQAAGTLLVSGDLHGNLDDLLTLRRIFEERLARRDDCLWVGLGDWIHGPVPGRSTVRWAGEELFDYPDRSIEVLDIVRDLFRAHPGRFFSILGNHEHAHIGGELTCRFHSNEAMFLESRMAPDKIAAMHKMVSSWPLIVQVPSCGVVLSHGAPNDECLGTKVIDDVTYDESCPADSVRFLDDVLWKYGLGPRSGRRFLDHLSLGAERYDLIVHGHDRELDGGAPDGEHGFLLCTSFGARRVRKAFLLLDLSCRYHGPADLRKGIEIRRLYGRSVKG